MERNIAEKLMKIFCSLGNPLNEASKIVEQISDEKERTIMRRGLGEIMARIFTELETHIIRQYPEFDPDKDSDWLKTLKPKNPDKK